MLINLRIYVLYLYTVDSNVNNMNTTVMNLGIFAKQYATSYTVQPFDLLLLLYCPLTIFDVCFCVEVGLYHGISPLENFKSNILNVLIC